MTFNNNPRHSNAAALNTDATNRAVRTFLVGLVIDITVAAAMVITEATSNADDVDWRLLGALLAKTVVASAGSYVLRRFGDPSRLPTPLPPEQPGEPADHEN